METGGNQRETKDGEGNRRKPKETEGCGTYELTEDCYIIIVGRGQGDCGVKVEMDKR